MEKEPRRGYLPYLEINVLTRTESCTILGTTPPSTPTSRRPDIGVQTNHHLFTHPLVERPSPPWKLSIYSSALETLPWLIYPITYYMMKAQ